MSSEKSGAGVRLFFSFNIEGKSAPDERGRSSEANFNPTSGVEYKFQFNGRVVKIKREGVESR